MLRNSSKLAALLLGASLWAMPVALAQTMGGGGGGVPPPLCGDASHALGGTGTAFTCQAITGSAAAGGSNTQVQYNNSGALGGITGATTNGTSVTLTSPTLVTPALGTPASGNASNLTNVPVNQATGLLPTANGGLATDNSAASGVPVFSSGTATTTATTGTGNVVRATSPTLVTPNLGTPASGVGTNLTGIPPGAVTSAQGNGTKFQFSTGSTTTNDCVKYDANGNTVDAGSACGSGGGGTPGGSNTQLQYNNSGSFGGISGATSNGTSVTLTSPTFVTPVLGTPSSGDASNLTNLNGTQVTSGTVPSARLPLATTSVFGAFKPDGSSITCTAGVCSAPTGGSGTVTSVATGACLTGGPVTTTGTISGNYVINAQTGTSYTFVSGDACKLVTHSNGSATADTLPQATGSFAAGWSVDVENKGAGVVTITPTTSTINGASSMTLAQNTGCSIVSDGTNYQVSACTAVAPSSGTVTSVVCGTGLSGGTITTTGTCSLNLGSQNAWTAEQDNCVTTLTISTATFTPDGTCNNYKIVLVHASCPCTLANFSTTRTGAAGVIEIDQSSTGSDTIGTYGSQLIAPGGTSTLTYSSGANAKDFFSYYNADTTHTLLVSGALNATH